ncbi:MAG: hypothetical protein KDK76_04260 [Chlamydiia bacterium]|nr:hypothetical protein [Chlamydiia bacterium]
MEAIKAGFKVAGEFVVGMGMTAFNKMNSDVQVARDNLKNQGLEVLGKYQGNQNVTAQEVKELASSLMQPLQTLENVGVGATLSLLLVYHYTPLFKGVVQVAMLGSAYLTYQASCVREQVHQEVFYFERRGTANISRDEFKTHVENLGDRILASSSLVRTLTAQAQMEGFRNLGTVVGEMIDNVQDPGQLQATIDKVPTFILKLYHHQPQQVNHQPQ